MPTRVNKVNRIIATITVEVKSIYGFVVKISSVIRGNKSTPFGGIIAGIEVVKVSFLVIVITSVTYGINVSNIRTCTSCDCTITPRIVGISNLNNTACVVDSSYVALKVLPL